MASKSHHLRTSGLSSRFIRGLSACLLLVVVKILVLALGFEHAQRGAFAAEHIIGAPAAVADLKADLMRVEQLPAAELQRLVNQDAGECFVLR